MIAIYPSYLLHLCSLIMPFLTDHTILRKEIFDIQEAEFERFAIQIFKFQFEQNPFYHEYCRAINTDVTSVKHINQIPFLPIQFFKSKKITTTQFEPELVFESSGTTGSVNSKHYIKDISLYGDSFLKNIENTYGKIDEYCILGLLPSYLERKNSSLVWMVQQLIEKSKYTQSGFHLSDFENLKNKLLHNENESIPTLLIGVTYALLDFFEKNPMQLSHCIVIETGGMKGRKSEMTRTAVHNRLKALTSVNDIHSEYGMTELLSQAYAKKDGLFSCPTWMKVVLRKEDDPFDILFPGSMAENSCTGAINIIDLANLYSCSFVATDDVGRLFNNGQFEVLGRLDNSDIRGCSLMAI